MSLGGMMSEIIDVPLLSCASNSSEIHGSAHEPKQGNRSGEGNTRSREWGVREREGKKEELRAKEMRDTENADAYRFSMLCTIQKIKEPQIYAPSFPMTRDHQT